MTLRNISLPNLETARKPQTTLKSHLYTALNVTGFLGGGTIEYNGHQEIVNPPNTAPIKYIPTIDPDSIPADQRRHLPKSSKIPTQNYKKGKTVELNLRETVIGSTQIGVINISANQISSLNIPEIAGGMTAEVYQNPQNKTWKNDPISVVITGVDLNGNKTVYTCTCNDVCGISKERAAHPTEEFDRSETQNTFFVNLKFQNLKGQIIKGRIYLTSFNNGFTAKLVYNLKEIGNISSTFVAEGCDDPNHDDDHTDTFQDPIPDPLPDVIITEIQ